jgi:hypothetical protein
MAGIAFRFDLQGLKDIEQRLAGLSDTTTLHREMAVKLFAEATSIMNVSKTLVPVDTGFLRQSGHVQLPVIEGDRISVTLGYAAEYAIFVHENLAAHHKVGTAKFLEIPLISWKAGALEKVAEAFRAAAGIGRGSLAA